MHGYKWPIDTFVCLLAHLLVGSRHNKRGGSPATTLGGRWRVGAQTQTDREEAKVKGGRTHPQGLRSRSILNFPTSTTVVRALQQTRGQHTQSEMLCRKPGEVRSRQGFLSSTLLYWLGLGRPN